MKIGGAGGGVAGLVVARVLARSGHQTTVLERDPLEGDAPWQAAFGWARAGRPHFHPPHTFHPQGRQVLWMALIHVVALACSLVARPDEPRGAATFPEAAACFVLVRDSYYARTRVWHGRR